MFVPLSSESVSKRRSFLSVKGKKKKRIIIEKDATTKGSTRKYYRHFYTIFADRISAAVCQLTKPRSGHRNSPEFQAILLLLSSITLGSLGQSVILSIFQCSQRRCGLSINIDNIVLTIHIDSSSN